ncbi:MAG TPA: hypothetical protein VG122_09290 [Gemmata sp.]|jgi:hypothetical protein|nr:hypothetical protein [Gemmata sp.]
MFFSVFGTAFAVIILLYALSRYALVRQSAPASDTGSHPPDWLSSREVSLSSESAASFVVQDRWQTVTLDSLAAAEELLDLAEMGGYSERELVILGNTLFLVRWR